MGWKARRTAPSRSHLSVAQVATTDDGQAFALCHPRWPDGGVDPDRAIIVQIDGELARIVRQFDTEICSMVAVGSQLVLIDDDCNPYFLADGAFTDHVGAGDGLIRVGRLQAVGGELYGLHCDGILLHWTGKGWDRLTPEEEDLDLVDVVSIDGALVLAAQKNRTAFLAEVTSAGLKRCAATVERPISLLRAPDGALIVTGSDAFLAHGSTRRLARIDASARRRSAKRGQPPKFLPSFSNAIVWKERVLVAASFAVLALERDGVEVFAECPAMWLVGSETALWALTSDGVAAFRAGHWSEISLPGL